jgi:hypothetical protein
MPRPLGSGRLPGVLPRATKQGWVRSTMSSTAAGVMVVSYKHRPHTGKSSQTVLTADS